MAAVETIRRLGLHDGGPLHVAADVGLFQSPPMREGEASRTAQYMALFRALESCRPAPSGDFSPTRWRPAF